MKDENGKELSEEQIIEGALEHLSDACIFLYELESPKGIAAAYFANSVLIYAQSILNETDPRLPNEYFYAMDQC